MKAMNILRNFLLPMAFAALAACSTDEQPLAPQEITLTTPVLTLADASAGAAVSRAGEATVPMSEVSMMGLSPRLTKGMGQEPVGNQGSYVYTPSEGWNPGNTLTVTSGPGAYYAVAYALVYLVETEEGTFIENLRYTWQGSLLASEDGTFELDGAMTPVTAAIWVKLKDANGNDITDADELGSYDINYTGVESSLDPIYKEISEGSYGYVLEARNVVHKLTADKVYGWWYPSTYGTAGGSWELFSIKHNGTTYPVYYTGELTLEAGKLYTFTVQLNRDKQATIVGGISVSDFATGEQINIER